jgi:two-component system cell cycle sensor histidine kinase/response regulator CckA
MLSGKGGNILIVEDDPDVATLERLGLERAGYTVVTAGSAEEARRRLEGHAIDLILLDYRLPGNVDGLSFHAQLKAGGHDTPVILVTGFSEEVTVIRALRAGVRDFVTKSTQYLDYLPEAVRRVLQQVRTERQLTESEARLTGIISSAKDAIFIAESDQRITLFNAAAERMFRCPAAVAIGQPIGRFILPQHTPAPGEEAPDAGSMTLFLRSGRRGVRADGEEFPLEASVSRVRVAGRHYYAVVARDITGRQKAEERIREQAALLDKANDAILVRDMDGCIAFWNLGAQRLYGWTPREALGRKARELLYKSPPPDLTEAYRAVLERGEWDGELNQVTRDGKEVIVASRWSLVRAADGQPRSCLVINTDITEKKKLQRQYLHAQRLEGVGRLAGGVAHDFNNVLTIINGYSEVLLSRLSPDDPSFAPLCEIHKAGERAASLTRQLLAFSRKQVLAPQVLDLNALIRESEKMLHRLIGEDIILTTHLDPSLGLVKADPAQLELAIVNLVVNARDALPAGGYLTIETRNIQVDASHARNRPDVRPGPHVLLAVTDTGNGMDEATRAHIFEPFFTTKGPGQGTGLGLSTVFGIVKQSEGHVEVYSEPGQGTTFKIYLPQVQPAGNAPPAPPIDFKAPTGTETVLLAEDEEGVRALAHLALQSNGYTVLEARDGDEARTLSDRHAGPIHLLVTDVVMPKVSGRQLADSLTARFPELKVLYLSGYTDDAIVRHGVLQEGKKFLQKPFTPIALARKVREILDG